MRPKLALGANEFSSHMSPAHSLFYCPKSSYRTRQETVGESENQGEMAFWRVGQGHAVIVKEEQEYPWNWEVTLLVFSSVSLGTELSSQQTHMASAVTESKFLAGFTLIGLSTSQDSCEGFRVQSSGETAELPKSPTLLACSVWQGLLSGQSHPAWLWRRAESASQQSPGSRHFWSLI